MATLFLLLIYLTFISLGLPDSLLGAVWPVMRADIGADLGWAGVLSMIIAGGTVVSSLASERVVKRFGAGRVTAVSVLATAVSLFGFGFAQHFWWLAVLCVPLGLGAGAVDAALNNYVALHYEARHMSWLHSFWGIGAVTGPIILAICIQRESGWRGGYQFIGAFQIFVSILLILSLRLWDRKKGQTPTAHSHDSVRMDVPAMPALRIPGVFFALITFLLYSSIESSTGLWGSSYLVEERGMTEVWAARGAAAFFIGITVGRVLNGFIAARIRGNLLIRWGSATIIAGAVLLALPLPSPAAFAALVVIGLGCAPVYPSIIHETPRRFGAVNSQKVIGLQMAAAYCGTTFVPPVIGLIAGKIGLGFLPVTLAAFGVIMLLFSEGVTRAVQRDIRERAATKSA